jgi:hypothetical protein
MMVRKGMDSADADDADGRRHGRPSSEVIHHFSAVERPGLFHDAFVNAGCTWNSGSLSRPSRAKRVFK